MERSQPCTETSPLALACLSRISWPTQEPREPESITLDSKMSSNPYARPPKPYAAYSAAPSYYASTAAATASAVPYPAAAAAAASTSTSAYVAAAGPVLPAGYAAYPSVSAGPAYPGMMAGAGPSDLDAQQASIYTPEAARASKPVPAHGNGSKAKGRTTVLRKGGGEVWEDQTLLEWDPCQYTLRHAAGQPVTDVLACCSALSPLYR